ncbi:MAG: serine hydroxymethyltransferase [Firmicutes bacterium]|nr:serine hydroxymethyltransferase [Bacillota bacterium]
MIDYTVIEKFDPEIGASLKRELNRQRDNLELIASENFVSPAVMAAAGTILTNKYAEGYPAKRYYGGCQFVDEIESIAIERAKKLFNCGYANVQTHSGANANMAAYLALIKTGDTVLGMNLMHGGHLTHGSSVNMSGINYRIVPYGVNDKTETIDYDALEVLAKKEKPKLIMAGASAYSRTIDFKRFGEIAKAVGAYLVVDVAHIAGLIIAGQHPSPFPYADVVTTTTHKTLRGPRGGLILSNSEEIALKINKAVFPGLQGGPLMHIIAAKAVAFKEALQPEFKSYQKQVVKNAAVLAKTLLEKGIDLVSNGTDNHLMLVKLVKHDTTGKIIENLLDECRITANKNTIPNDPLSPFVTSGLRLGTPSVTTRGMKEDEMKVIGGLIADVILNKEKALERVAKLVDSLCKKFPLYE